VFDNLELIWNYDSSAVLKRLDIPMLWILAEQDREAPIETTLAALASLKAQGKPIDIHTFARTDHGMYEFVENADGTRTNTRVTDGYFRLVADWIAGRAGRN
jgi:pimeloyl-ACP methyl ester carboxylesterase